MTTADALLAKIGSSAWQQSPRVVAKLGTNPALNPDFYMAEDEDLLNILLWRYSALKQWCKWDVEPDIFDRLVFRCGCTHTWFMRCIPRSAGVWCLTVYS